MPERNQTATGCDCGGVGVCPACVADERDRLHEALQMMEQRVMAFGGFQRAEKGEFWISRDDVLRLIAEALNGE